MEYVSIRVNTLRGDQKIDFDVYIFIDGKYVHYLRQGDSFEGQRLERLKSKKLKKMYIKFDAENLYRNYIERNIDAAYNNKNKDLQLRAEIVQGDQQYHTEEVFENPQSAISYSQAKDTASKYIQFLIENEKAAENILSIQNTDSSISHHGLNVATLSVTLASQLGLFDDKQKQLMTLGALLHDFGHYNTTLDISKSVKDMSPSDQEIYWKHPKMGAEKVQGLKHFDQSVINIINQHEELINGQGPIGLREKDQDPLAILVSTANALDREILKSPSNREQVIKNFIVENVGKHPLPYLNGLKHFLIHI